MACVLSPIGAFVGRYYGDDFGLARDMVRLGKAVAESKRQSCENQRAGLFPVGVRSFAHVSAVRRPLAWKMTGFLENRNPRGAR